MSSTVNPKRHSFNITPGARPLHLLNETQSEPPSSPSPPSRRQSYREVERKHREPVTLTEKHADLLHFIAQKESKCLELRSQLAVHEAELLQLKRKWERIVSRGFERQQQTPSPSPTQTLASTPSPQQSAPTSPSLPPDTRDSGATPLISPAPDFSSWLSTVGVPNLPKKWDVPTLSKRASLLGQSIAQALDLSPPPPSTTRPLTGKTGRHSHSSSTPLASLNVSTPSRPSPSLPAKVPAVMSHAHSSSTPSSPSPLSANTPLPTPPATTTEEMNPTKPMSLARTPEEEEGDDGWNW
ncbi:uncharacterized protein EV420DRAFT_1486711 [Desarmillaria tabescens]|uniref:Uncharacterized protein n=1 Tax=Armillaria tabescens TaxID=1929756 RepID=A0AA39J8Y5_ARMTA|nr:uncharacterized protein EV420DRAFT_1486711 [Desarmillaria tabescens]KAK0438340.1 hypothetical protein EV420DRAFT_1486711 [Desarmillaria tabescens]